MGSKDKTHEFPLNQLEIDAASYSSVWHKRLQNWEADAVNTRIWNRDPSVWDEKYEAGTEVCELTDRLGWLELPGTMLAEVAVLTDFTEEIIRAGFSRVVVLGMGGSSLIAEVWAEIFGIAEGFLPVAILDSTHPQSVARMVAAEDLETTLFLVASKSGGTLETLSFFNYFYQQLTRLHADPGANFVALTDPGSRLEELAVTRKFRKIFHTPPEVGGRYSALTFFGLLPASLLGLPVALILAQAQAMAQACAPGVPATANPALELGSFLGEMVIAGRDKLMLVLSPAIKPFAVWLEQLIAESIGKSGLGLVPVIVADKDELPFHDYTDAISSDCIYLFICLQGDDNLFFDQALSQVQIAGEPAVSLKLTEIAGLGQEIWRFELAIAAIGAVLKINPFDQPDVEAAKIGARQAMSAWQENGSLPETESLFTSSVLTISGSRHFSRVNDLKSALATFVKAAQPGDYIALIAFLPRTEKLQQVLLQLQKQLQRCCRVPVTLGFGPRFLHSTGQLHKGDGNRGLFLQLSGSLQEDLDLPGSDYSFATLIAAQAQGDYDALLAKERRILALHWHKGEVESAILGLIEMIKPLLLPEFTLPDSENPGA